MPEPWIAPPVTDQQLRDAGFTKESRAFPRSEAGARWIANWNGIPFEMIPAAWCYASNLWMHAYVERLAATDTVDAIPTTAHP